MGAGGFGRELGCWLEDLPEANSTWKVCGFLDDNSKALEGLSSPLSIVGGIKEHSPSGGNLYVCGLGSQDNKRRICEALAVKGFRFMSVVHPSVIIGRNVKLGEGVVLCPRVTLTCDIEIGAMAMINCHTTVGHDVRIGAWATISSNCDLTGHTEIGEAAYFGSGARVIPGKKVGARAVVGAGSVVIRDVPEGVSVFGNPARIFN